MKKFRRENMSNIREMIQNETGVNFAGGNGFRMRHYVALAACMVCILSLSAFAFYKFNALLGLVGVEQGTIVFWSNKCAHRVLCCCFVIFILYVLYVCKCKGIE